MSEKLIFCVLVDLQDFKLFLLVSIFVKYLFDMEQGLNKHPGKF